MKKVLKNKRGITLITLIVAVTILIIISSMLIYNAKNGIKMRNLKMMQNDIEMLDDKINAYYIKYGTLPIQILYIGGINFEPQANDGSEYYVIDLSALEGLTLNYGLDYENIETEADTKDYTDIYIINKQSHHIYYVRGIEMDGVMYYTNYDEDEDIPIKLIPHLSLEEVSEKTVNLILNVTNGSNLQYTYKVIVNGEEFQSGTTSKNTIELGNYNTIFDVRNSRCIC